MPTQWTLRNKLQPHQCEVCGGPVRRKQATEGKNAGRYEPGGGYRKRKTCSDMCHASLRIKLNSEWRGKIDAKKLQGEAPQMVSPGGWDTKILKRIFGKEWEGWLTWANEIWRDRNFDPIGFAALANNGRFQVKQKDAAGAGILGVADFKPRKFQDDWYHRIAHHRRFGEGRFSVLVVKSRQMGFTVGHDIALIGDATCNAAAGVCITAAQPGTLLALGDNIRTFFRRSKEQGLAKRMADAGFETLTGSRVTLHSAGDSLARGDSPLHLHVSEADYIDDIDSALDSALPAINRSNMATVVLESTIRAGSTTGFKRFLSRSLQGKTAYQVVFYGWADDESATLPVDDSARADFEESLSEYERGLLAGWTDSQGVTRKCSLEQVRWWRQRFLEDARGDLDAMKEMNPRDIDEAVGAALEGEWLDPSATEFYKIQVRPPAARYQADVENSPALVRLTEGSQWIGTPHMQVWRPPDSDKDYALIADPSGGTMSKGSSENFALIMDIREGEVVALWHARSSVYGFANACAAMGYYFNTALIVAENTKDGGLIEGLNIRLGYPRLYHMEHFDRDNFWAEKQAIGFRMDKNSRPKAMDRLRMCWNQRRLLIPSATLIDQVEHLAALGGDASAKKRGAARIKPVDGADCLAVACLVRDWSSNWKSRRGSEAAAYFAESTQPIDNGVRESVNTLSSDWHDRFADTQRVADALRELRGG